MSEIASAFVRIRPNMAGFQAETSSGVKSAFAGIAKIAGAALGAGEAVKFTKDIVQGAAQVQKSTESIRSGFGSAAQSVLDFTDKSGKGLGISAAAGEATASKFALLFGNMGIGKVQAAGMTVGFEKLGGTLAAIKGQDPSDVMNSLTMAAAGNTRGLKQLGIVIDANQIKHEALKLGLLTTAKATDASRIADERIAIAKANLANAEQKYGAGTTQVATAQIALQQAQAKANAESGKIVGTLTPAAKAQAIYALATKDLSSLQTEAGKHSGDLINVQHRLSAEWSNAKDELGAKLLPVVTKVATVLADNLPRAFDIAHRAAKILSDFFRDHVQGPFDRVRDSAVQLSIVLVTRLRDPFNDIRDQAGRVGEKLAGLVPSLDSVKSTASSVADAMKAAINFTVQYQNVLLPLGGALGSITLAMEAWTVATEVWSSVTAVATGIQEAFNLSMEANPIGIIILAIVGLVGALVVLYERSNTVHQAVNAMWFGIRDAAVAAWAVIEPLVVGGMRVIRDVVVTTWNIVKTATLTAWELVRIEVQTVINVIRDIINVFLDVIHGNWGKAWKDIEKLVTDILDGIANYFRTWWHGAVSIFSSYTDGVKRIFSDMWNAVGGMFQAAGKWIQEKSIEIALKVIEPFSHLPKWLGGGWAQDMKSNLTSALDALKAPAGDAGSAVGSSFGQSLGNAATAAVGTAVDAMKSQLSSLGGLIPTTGGPTSQGAPPAIKRGAGRMSSQDIYKLLIGAGFSPNDAANFVGIAGAESGGKYGALNNNPSTGDYSVGLFQENFFKALGPSRTARYAPQFGLNPNMTPESFVAWLQQHPAAQAKIAADLFNSSGYAPWAGDAFIKAHPELLNTGAAGTTSGAGAGTGTSDLTVGTVAPKFSGAATKSALESTYKTIAAHAKELGTALTSQIKDQMAEARAAIADVSNASTARSARERLKALGTAVSTALKDLRTELSLEKTFDGLKAAAAKLGTEVSPEIKKQMADIRSEIGKATTPQELASLHKQMADVKQEITDQLAEVRARIALTNTFDGLTRQAAKLHEDITPVLQAEMKDIQDRIATASTPASRAKLKSDMAQVKAEITTQLAAIKATISADKTSFAGAFSELMSGADNEFDRATQRALRDMQVTVTGAFESFTFGGSVAQTPTEVALQALQDAHDAAAAQAKLTADQAQEAADRLAGNKDAVVQDAQTVADDLYGMRVSALQKQVQVERAAAAQQLGDAQTAYQQQRDLLKQQMDQRTALIEKGMEDGSIAASDGLAQLTAVFDDPRYALDLQNSGLIIGGNLYAGLAQGLDPVFALLTKLQNEMRRAGIHVSVAAGPTTAGAGSVAPGLGPGSPGDRDAAAAAKDTASTMEAILFELHKQTEIARDQAENGTTVVVVGSDANAAVAGAKR